MTRPQTRGSVRVEECGPHLQGDEAFLYFECHDVGEFATGGFDDPSVKTIVNDSYLAGTLRNIDGTWVFWYMTAGSSSPLSYDTYYFPIP